MTNATISFPSAIPSAVPGLGIITSSAKPFGMPSQRVRTNPADVEDLGECRADTASGQDGPDLQTLL